MASNMSAFCASLQPRSMAENFDVLKLNIESLVPLTYGIPSCLVSISVIYILLCKKGRKEFNGSFYTCFAVTSMIDLITWIILLLFKELCTAPLLDPIFSLIPEASIIVTWIYASQIYFTLCSLINPVVLSLNRFVGLIFYTQDQEIWRTLSKLIVIFYFFFPLMFTWQLFTIQPIKKCRVQNFNSTDAYHTFNLEPPAIFVPNNIVCSYTIFTSGFINITLNGIIIVVLIIRRRQDSSKPVHKRRVPELKLFFIALIGCINVMLEVVYFTMIRVLPNGSTIKPAFLDMLPFILDWYYLSPIWTILILSPKLRKRLLSFIYGKTEANVVKPVSIHPVKQQMRPDV